MARYFLDTNVLEGLTFLHDAWRDEAERLFDTRNSLFIGDGVLFEYCNEEDEKIAHTDLDWDTEAGRFGVKLSEVRLGLFSLEGRLYSYDDDELDLEVLVEEFLKATGVTDGTDPALINEYIRPRIRTFLKEEIDGREITSEVATEIITSLCYTIQDHAREQREEIQKRVTVKQIDDLTRREYFDELSYIRGFIDTYILSGVAHLTKQNFLHKIVSSDNSHMYSKRDQLRADYGIVVVFIKDEFARPPKL